MPVVSIIVPNYNHARFLRQRIGSILAQTFQDFELILLDDCSTDNSVSILQEYASDPRVKLSFNETNSGSTFKQWNKGVRIAVGKYVWIAESDDYSDARFLEQLVPILDSDSKITLAWCRSWRVLDDGSVQEFPCYLPDPERWETSFIMDGPEACRRYLALAPAVPNASAVVFRKSAYEQVGGADEGLRIAGDWKLWAAVALQGELAYVCEPLNYFRFHRNTVRAHVDSARIDATEYLHVSRWILDRVAVSNAELETICEARAGTWVPAIMSFRTSFDAKRRIARAVRELDPHPVRRAVGPAMATIQRKILLHCRQLRGTLTGARS